MDLAEKLAEFVKKYDYYEYLDCKENDQEVEAEFEKDLESNVIRDVLLQIFKDIENDTDIDAEEKHDARVIISLILNFH